MISLWGDTDPTIGPTARLLPTGGRAARPRVALTDISAKTRHLAAKPADNLKARDRVGGHKRVRGASDADCNPLPVRCLPRHETIPKLPREVTVAAMV